MIKICLSLVVGIGLTLAANSGHAKIHHPAAEKSTRLSVKHAKSKTKSRLKKHVLARSSKIVPFPVLKSVDSDSPIDQIIPDPPVPLLTAQESQPTPAGPEGKRIHSLIPAHPGENKTYLPLPAPAHDYVSTHGVVESSLTAAAERAGLADDLVSQLTTIFAWDIDFAHQLQEGDQFTVIYENTESSRQIVAAEFITGGKTFTALRYKGPEGQINFYSPEGKLMRKAFLSAPLDFIRISSSYSTRRKHPVLNRIRAHKGVDYAARTGTPIKAAGDGEVIFLGRKGGYGQVIILKHGERYETLYAHLAGFKSGLTIGNTVSQGEIIGYVGQTGLATGPHLHYEFRIDGEHRNPEMLNRQRALPLAGEKLVDFKIKSQPLMAQLYQTKARSIFAKSAAIP